MNMPNYEMNSMAKSRNNIKHASNIGMGLLLHLPDELLCVVLSKLHLLLQTQVILEQQLQVVLLISQVDR